MLSGPLILHYFPTVVVLLPSTIATVFVNTDNWTIKFETGTDFTLIYNI